MTKITFKLKFSQAGFFMFNKRRYNVTNEFVLTCSQENLALIDFLLSNKNYKIDSKDLQKIEDLKEKLEKKANKIDSKENKKKKSKKGIKIDEGEPDESEPDESEPDLT
jgi:hypothetical protein